MNWDFYGRSAELEQLTRILERERWFFARVSGRRRIGKTALIRQALRGLEQRSRPVLYMQTPDSAPAGVLSVAADALEVFGVDRERFPPPTSLAELAALIARLARAGYVVALDEFQYFVRKSLYEFTSYLQAEVDALTAEADRVPGGLFVLGSIHTEMAALLEDRRAPLFHRATHVLDVDHWDVATVLEILRAHGNPTPEQLLFLWNLFEGVPKYYRDCFEHEALNADRATVLERMFFRSSSPLRAEAEHWFLHELRGRYDALLKFIARNPGCSNARIREHIQALNPNAEEPITAYLQVLCDKYRMVERRQPIFAKKGARRGRYYLTDNFLRSWLSSLAQPVTALEFSPVERLIEDADRRLMIAEGFGLERLAAALVHERGRRGLGDMDLTERVQGYWDRSGTEIDLIAVSSTDRVIRFGTCKRSAAKLPPDLPHLQGHIARFLENHPRFVDWKHEIVAVAPEIPASIRAELEQVGVIPQDLRDLAWDL